jgi:predicted RNA-binding protein YlqC (UPF0109 family)
VTDVHDGNVRDDDEEFDDDDEDEVDDGNRIVGALPTSVLTYLAKSIVEEPDAVVVETEERRNSVTLRLHVASGDMGRVIGRRGRVAQAIRSVVRAAGARDNVDASVDIVD